MATQPPDRKTVEEKLVTKPATYELVEQGAATRRRRELDPELPTALGKQISHIAGKHNVVIEWTVKPLDPGDVAACACHCSWACTCYAMPESHAEVVLDPGRIGRRILEADNVDLGALFQK